MSGRPSILRTVWSVPGSPVVSGSVGCSIFRLVAVACARHLSIVGICTPCSTFGFFPRATAHSNSRCAASAVPVPVGMYVLLLVHTYLVPGTIDRQLIGSSLDAHSLFLPFGLLQGFHPGSGECPTLRRGSTGTTYLPRTEFLSVCHTNWVRVWPPLYSSTVLGPSYRGQNQSSTFRSCAYPGCNPDYTPGRNPWKERCGGRE